MSRLFLLETFEALIITSLFYGKLESKAFLCNFASIGKRRGALKENLLHEIRGLSLLFFQRDPYLLRPLKVSDEN